MKLQTTLITVYGCDANLVRDKDHLERFGRKLCDVIKMKRYGLPFVVRFGEGELEGYKYALRSEYKGRFKIQNVVGWKGESPIIVHWMTVKFDKNRKLHPFFLMKLPIFKNLVKDEIANTEKNFGAYLPINKSLNYGSQVLPLKVFKYFIDRASHIAMRYKCGCRHVNGCQLHDHNIGCMYMGRDTLNILIPEDKGKVATKEEALERVKLAVEDGLIPLIGRAMDEAVAFGVEDTGHFFSMCFCCACCCVDIKILKPSNTYIISIFGLVIIGALILYYFKIDLKRFRFTRKKKKRK